MQACTAELRFLQCRHKSPKEKVFTYDGFGLEPVVSRELPTAGFLARSIRHAFLGEITMTVDRVVLMECQGLVKAVILPPPFEHAPYCVYVIGPTVPQLELLAQTGCRHMVTQQLSGTSFTWDSVRAMVAHCSIAFVAVKGDSISPLDPDFSSCPEDSPFERSGSGWIELSSQVGFPFALRRSPLLRPSLFVKGFHPHLYVCAARPDPTRGVYVNLGFSPDFPDPLLPNVDLSEVFHELDAIEKRHTHGFCLPLN